jgi:hypothetical protein
MASGACPARLASNELRARIRGQAEEYGRRAQRDQRQRHKGPFEILRCENIGDGVEQSKALQPPAPAVTPRLSDNCWAADEKLTARLILEVSMSAKTIALRLVNSSERTKPQVRSTPIMRTSGVEGVKKTVATE